MEAEKRDPGNEVGNGFVSDCFYDDLGEGSGASPISLG